MAQVTGRVVDASGTPVSGVYVYALPATGARFGQTPGAYTRRDGSWQLELPPGAWKLRETGRASHDVAVGETAIDLDPAAPSPTLPAPKQDLARLLERRRATREEV